MFVDTRVLYLFTIFLYTSISFPRSRLLSTISSRRYINFPSLSNFGWELHTLNIKLSSWCMRPSVCIISNNSLFVSFSENSIFLRCKISLKISLCLSTCSRDTSKIAGTRLVLEMNLLFMRLSSFPILPSSTYTKRLNRIRAQMTAPTIYSSIFEIMYLLYQIFLIGSRKVWLFRNFLYNSSWQGVAKIIAWHFFSL